jgi:hypothetical protein
VCHAACALLPICVCFFRWRPQPLQVQCLVAAHQLASGLCFFQRHVACVQGPLSTSLAGTMGLLTECLPNNSCYVLCKSVMPRDVLVLCALFVACISTCWALGSSRVLVLHCSWRSDCCGWCIHQRTYVHAVQWICVFLFQPTAVMYAVQCICNGH